MCSSCGEDFSVSVTWFYIIWADAQSLFIDSHFYVFFLHPIMLHKQNQSPTEFLLVRKTDFLYILFYNTVKIKISIWMIYKSYNPNGD